MEIIIGVGNFVASITILSIILVCCHYKKKRYKHKIDDMLYLYSAIRENARCINDCCYEFFERFGSAYDSEETIIHLIKETDTDDIRDLITDISDMADKILNDTDLGFSRR